VKFWDAILIAMNLRDLPLRDDETDYPPFVQNSRCPKCGFHGVEDSYSGHSTVFVPAHTEVRGAFRISRPARMRRDCRRCGAGWYELPLDATKAAT
jgi:ribosomal protein S27AE